MCIRDRHQAAWIYRILIWQTCSYESLRHLNPHSSLPLLSMGYVRIQLPAVWLQSVRWHITSSYLQANLYLERNNNVPEWRRHFGATKEKHDSRLTLGLVDEWPRMFVPMSPILSSAFWTRRTRASRLTRMNIGQILMALNCGYELNLQRI